MNTNTIPSPMKLWIGQIALFNRDHDEALAFPRYPETTLRCEVLSSLFASNDAAVGRIGLRPFSESRGKLKQLGTEPQFSGRGLARSRVVAAFDGAQGNDLMLHSSHRDFTLWPKPGTELSRDLDGISRRLPAVGGWPRFEEVVGNAERPD